MGEMNYKLKGFLRDKESFAGQIIKYIICGGLAVIVDFMTFYLLAVFAFPCLRDSDPVARLLALGGFAVQTVSAEELARNFWIIKGFCFLVSNAVVYTLNSLFVFEAGRHRKSVEILLFFGSSLFQFFFIWLGSLLITIFHWEVTYSNITMLLVSMMVNYIIRKKVVFKG
jgi:putative flippase GtrA